MAVHAGRIELQWFSLCMPFAIPVNCELFSEGFQQKVRRYLMFNSVIIYVRFLLSFSKKSFFFKCGSVVSLVFTSNLQFNLVISDIHQFRVSLMIQLNKSSFG